MLIILALLLNFLTPTPALAEDYQPSATILSTSQFYFIPDNEYFQFRLSSAEMGDFSRETSISKSTYEVSQLCLH